MTIADRLAAIAEPLPDGSAVTLPVSHIRAWLAEEHRTSDAPSGHEIVSHASGETWRTRLWTCDAEVRLGAHELCEALGRSRDWVYRAVNKKRAEKLGRNPLPCARLDGALVFTAGAVRKWVKASALIVNTDTGSLRVTK